MAILAKNAERKQLNLKTITWRDLTWVDIVQPTKEETKYLADNYHFNPMDIEDVLSLSEVPKIEEYPEYLFIVVHLSVYDKATRVSSRKQWSAFVGKKFLVTLHPPELKVMDELFRECQVSEETRDEYLSYGSGYLLYHLFDLAIDRYFKVLHKLLSLLENIEDNVFKEEVEVAREISILRRDIITQRRIMFPVRSQLQELEKKMKSFSIKDLTPFWGDMMDHMNKVCETLDEYNEVIEVFKDTDYLLSGYRANRVIRILAILFAIGLPFLIVSGLYGMHVTLPGGVAEGDPQIFFKLLAIILVSIGAILYFLRRRRLI